jgi:hypothetical protein
MLSPAEFSKCPHCELSFTADPKGETLEQKNAFWALKAHVEAVHSEGMFRCPRQGEGGPMSEGKQAFWRGDGTCSYCGSLSPEKFFEACERGDELGPTDKSYKVYVHRPNPEAGHVVRIGSETGPLVDRDGNWRVENPTPEEIAAGRYDRPIYGTASATTHDKFYFQHLDEAGQVKFIDLYNTRKLRLGFPGHFYRLPFFCTPGQRAAVAAE